MSFRFTTILWALVIVFGAVGIYMVKYKVQDLKKEVALIEETLLQEKKNIHILRAEWAFLTRPERIRKLSEKYLTVQPITAKQIVDISTIPYTKNEVNLAVDNKASLVKMAGGIEDNE
jgi:cell division protein FtsL